MPEVEPRYAGYVAWRGVLDESAMRPGLHAEIFERYVFCLPEGEMVIAYPVPGPHNDLRPGRRSYNLVWYHPVDEAELRALCTDATGHYHRLGIPPPLIRPEAIRDIRAVAHNVLAPQIAEVMELTPQLFSRRSTISKRRACRKDASRSLAMLLSSRGRTSVWA